MEVQDTRSKTLVKVAGALLLLLEGLPGHSSRVARSAPADDQQLIWAVNLGGPKIGAFEADDESREGGGIPWSTTETIVIPPDLANPAPAVVYRTGLTGAFTQTFGSLTAGASYIARIHYAEALARAPGDRASDVYVNDQIVRSYFDVFGATGTRYTATVREYAVQADGWGRVTISFRPADPSAAGVCVAAIEIQSAALAEPAPVAWWRFDEMSGKVAKDALGVRPGTVMGASWSVGRLGGALVFNGYNNHVRVENLEGLIIQPFSISCWVKGGRSSAGAVIASLQDGRNVLRASPTDGFLRTELAGAGKPLTSRAIITDNAWHAICVVFDGARLQLYADANEVATMPQGALAPFTGRLYIGAGSSLAPGSFWAGSVDDVRIYDRALSQAEVTQSWEDAQKIETTFFYSQSKERWIMPEPEPVFPEPPPRDSNMPPAVMPVPSATPTTRASLALNLDRLGALAALPGARATEKEMRDFAENLGLRWLDYLEPGNVVLLGLPPERQGNRIQLAALAREIRALLKKPGASTPFREVGMVVKAGESDVPMLVLDDFIVKFWPETTRQQIDVLNAGNAVEVVEKNPYRENQFLLRVTAQSPGDAMAIANRYHESWLTEYAHPDFVAPIDSRARLLDDELLAEQWHHNNTGQDNGTPDADMDTPEAWEITTGSPEVVIAVIDHGFDVNHPDLIENLWVNERELTGASNTDDDGNHFIDDLHGWNFQTNTSTPLACRHGTAAAGCAGARGNNGIGACGSCPDCRLMLLEYGDGIYGKTYAIDYARANGADIISNSWGFWSNAFPGVFPDLEDALREAANQGRGGLGCVVFFAMTNDEVDNGRPGDAAYDISALDEVIAVSASTNNDRKRRPAGYGNSMDILSPTNGGTRCITTTDNRDFLLHLCNRIDHVGCGYNCGGSAGCQGPDPQPNNGEYTFCFTGTSAACPIAAGVGGLVLSAAPDLTRVEVQRLLQDTADKIEPSVASYSPVNGFSLGKKGIATHGYGRINAFEAVRTVGPKDKGGRAGVDLFLRDNDLDWGNTEQPSSTLFEPTRGFLPYWESPDIKIDPDCGAEVPALGIGAFAALDYKKNPKAGKTNGIYVRVRNRGPRPASGVVVTLYWCLAEPNQEPDLPDRFWDEATGNSWDTTPWKPLGASPIGMLHYSGSSVAGSYGDDAEIASFRFSPGLDQTGPCCLLAVVHSDQDPVSDNSKRRVKLRGITPYDNNVTQRAVVIGGSE